MSKESIFLSCPLKPDTQGGGEKLLDNLLQNLTGKSLLLGYNKTLKKVFIKQNKKIIENRYGFEPVTPKNLVLLPVTILLSLLFVIKHGKKLKKTNTKIYNLIDFTALVFVIPWINLFYKKKVYILLQNAKYPKILQLPLIKHWFKYIYKTNQVYCVSNSQKDYFSSSGILPQNTQVLYPGIAFRQTNLKIPKASWPLTIGYLGRLEEEKGFDIFLALVKELSTNTKINFLVAGKGNLASNLKSLRQKNLKYCGFLEKPDEFLQSIDLLIQPSKVESFGLSVLEAYACGVSVLSSDLKVFEEIKDFYPKLESELIFRDTLGLINKVDELTKNKNLLRDKNYKTELQNITQKHFNFDRVVKKFS